MLFNSFHYFLFLPIVAAVFFRLRRTQWMWLLAASCYFYMAFIPAYILILGFTIAIDYVAGILIEGCAGRRRRLMLAVSILANVGVLAVFKYWNFLGHNFASLTAVIGTGYVPPRLDIILPIGLSFHTFQAMSYTIEVYRGTFAAERHLGRYALYVMFFPQLVAGPIERPHNLLPQLRAVRTFDASDAVIGLRWIMWGLFKKIVVADRIGPYVDIVYAAPGEYSGAACALATVFFAIQIYCDFSGYSDIALGSAKVLGYDIMVNFRQPYLATSIREFWQRWHISLSTWFRDYLYIPLGGNRISLARTQLNILLVFTISGLWHGANWTFAIWGLIHGVLFLVQALWRGVSRPLNIRIPKLVSWTITMGAVTLAWVFFRAENLSTAVAVLTRMSSGLTSPRGILRPLASGTVFELAEIAIAIVCVIAVDLAIERRGSINNLIASLGRVQRLAVYYAAIFAVLLYGAWGRREFIYFQF